MTYTQKEPIAHEQILASSGVVGPSSFKLTRASVGFAANFGMFRNGAGDVRWRDDGTDPTATNGYLLKAGEELQYDGKLGAIKFTRVSADSIMDCAYYRV